MEFRGSARFRWFTTRFAWNPSGKQTLEMPIAKLAAPRVEQCVEGQKALTQPALPFLQFFLLYRRVEHETRSSKEEEASPRIFPAPGLHRRDQLLVGAVPMSATDDRGHVTEFLERFHHINLFDFCDVADADMNAGMVLRDILTKVGREIECLG